MTELPDPRYEQFCQLPWLNCFRIEPQDPGDHNCENFAYTVPPHHTPDGSPCSFDPNRIVWLRQIITPFGGPDTWTCECGISFLVYIPLNSEMG